MSETAVTALVFDARPAQQGARDFEAAAQRILGANDRVAEATQRVVDSSSRMERALAALQRQTDPVGAAQERLARGQSLLQQALDRGRISADEYSRRLELLNQRYAQAAAGATAANAAAARQAAGFAAANDNVTRSSGGVRAALGQAGFQVQDFVAQVGSGQNALLAFGQQASQLAGAFGPGGAIAGAVLIIGSVAANLLLMGENGAEAQRRIEASFQGLARAGEEHARILREVNDLYLTQDQRAAAATARTRQELIERTRVTQSILIQRNEANVLEIRQAEEELRRLERLAEAERRLNERSRGGALGQAARDQDQEQFSQLAQARQRLVGLRGDIDRVNAALGEANESLRRLTTEEPPGSGSGGGGQGGGRTGATRREVERLTEAERILQQQINDGVRLAERAADATQVYARQVSSLQLALAAGRITQDDYNRAVRELDPAAQAAARAADEAAQAARRFRESSVEAFARIGESALDRIGQGLVNAFLAGQGEAVNFGNLARSVIASVASELLKLAAINPLSNALLGTSRPTLGGALGGQSGGGLGSLLSGGAGSAGSLMGGLRSIGSALDFSNLGNLGGLTPYLFGSANSGVYAATSTPGVFSAVPDPGLFGTGGTIAGLPAASAIGGALGLVGGGLGIYSGIQRGGVGGAVGVAGGLAGIGAGLGALGVAGFAALAPVLGPLALALPLIAAFLPGQRPSGQQQGAYSMFGSGAVTTAGLGGARYSAQNAAISGNFLNSILAQEAALASVLGFNAAGGAFTTVTGGRGRGPGTLGLAIGNSGLRTFTNDEAGQKAAAEAAVGLLFDAFRDAAQGRTDDMARIVQGSPTFQALQENLTWFEGAYRRLSGAFEQAVPRASQFGDAIRELQRPFQESITLAQRFGLSTAGLTANRDRALDEFLGDALNQAQGRGFLAAARQIVLDRGVADFETRGSRTSILFDIAGAQLKALFEPLGLDELATVIRTTTDEQARLIAEATRAQKESAAAQMEAARAQGIRDFVLGQRSTSGPGGPSPAQALQELQRQFGAQLGLARQGDADALSGITGTAQRLLESGANVFGSSVTFQELRRFTLQSLSALPGVGLASESTASLAPVIRAGDQAVVNEIQALRADNARQADDIRRMAAAIERLERNAQVPVGTRAA